MHLTVSDYLFHKYPDLRIGVIILSEADNSKNNEDVKNLLSDIQKNIKKNFNAENISKNQRLLIWRKVYSEFGSKPSDYRSSIEALIRSIIKDREIPHINTIVDLYNFISLKYVVPAGGEDLKKIKGNIYLKPASGSETFTPLNSEVKENPYSGEIIYCDDDENVLCRRWNWRESDKTKITKAATDSIIVIEGFDDQVEQALKELESLMKRFCSAKTLAFIVNKNNFNAKW